MKEMYENVLLVNFQYKRENYISKRLNNFIM